MTQPAHPTSDLWGIPFVVKTRALAEACDKASAKRKLFEDKFGIKLVPQTLTEGLRTVPVRNVQQMQGGIFGIEGGVSAPSYSAGGNVAA